MKFLVDVLWLVLGYLLITGSLHAADMSECDALAEQCQYMHEKAVEAIEYQRGLIAVQNEVIENKDAALKLESERVKEMESNSNSAGFWGSIGFMAGSAWGYVLFVVLLPIGL